MKKQFDWKMASEEEMIERINNDSHKSFLKTVHYYKHRENTVMYERIRKAWLKSSYKIELSFKENKIKKIKKIPPSGYVRNTFHWDSASVEEMVERMHKITRKTFIDKLRITHDEITRNKMQAAMKIMLDKDFWK